MSETPTLQEARDLAVRGWVEALSWHEDRGDIEGEQERYNWYADSGLPEWLYRAINARKRIESIPSPRRELLFKILDARRKANLVQDLGQRDVALGICDSLLDDLDPDGTLRALVEEARL